MGKLLRSTLAAAVLLPSALGCRSSGSSSTPTEAPAPDPAPIPVATGASPEAPGERIDGELAAKLVRDGARLVDVRTPEEFADGHIPSAENVPVDDLEGHDLGPKDRAIVVYCRSGKRSARAAAALRAKGHERVFDLGGMSNWKE